MNNISRFGAAKITNLEASYNIESRLRTYPNNTAEEAKLAATLNSAMERYENVLDRVGFLDQGVADLDNRPGAVTVGGARDGNTVYSEVSLSSRPHAKGLPFNQTINLARIQDEDGQDVFNYATSSQGRELVRLKDPVSGERYHIEFSAGPNSVATVFLD